MVVLLIILISVVVSIALVLCAFALRSVPLATLNLSLWAVGAFVCTPWFTLTEIPPSGPDERLAWDSSLIWAVFFGIGICILVYCLIASRKPMRPSSSKRRRRKKRRERSSAPTPTGAPSTATEESGRSAWRV